MGWLLVIITAGSAQMWGGTVDRAIQPLGGPWSDRAQCEAALEQQPPRHDGTLACIWQMPLPQEDHAQPDRGA